MFRESVTDIILLLFYDSRVLVCVCVYNIIMLYPYVAVDPVSRNDRFRQDAFSIRYAKNVVPRGPYTNAPPNRYIIHV
jgi:hypothetical protein